MNSTATSWRSVPFWTLFSRTKRTGFAHEQLLSVYRDYGVVRRKDRDDNINRVGQNLHGYQLVNIGDLAVNKMKAWQGSLGVSPYKGIVSPAYFVYESNTGDDPRFLHYALRSDRYIENYKRISKGVRPGQWDLQPEHLDQMKVAIPPLQTQRRIADYLDRETGQIDTMIEKLNILALQLIDRKSALPNSTFDDLYRKKTVPLWSILEPVKDQGFPDEEVLSVYRDYGVIVKSSRDDNINTTPDNLDPYQLVLPGDVVINKMKAWQGSLGVSEYRGIVSPDYQVVRPTVELHPRYIHTILRAPRMVSQYRNRSIGVRPTQWRLYWGEMSALHVPVPPLEEQRRIADHLDDVTSKIDTMLAKVAELKDLLTERRAALITDVVTGRKDVA